MTELLAPAGDLQAGYAAFAYGADAVYLGLPKFSARAEAINFSEEEFKTFVAYAHQNKKKVLVAVNTVFFDNELNDLIDTLAVIRDAKADGVIVQDLGTARIIKKYFPSLRLHGSTQMAIHNRQGVEALRDFGFKRVVLARELTLDEIKDICSVPGIEKEVFIHGALCYSYSGLCLFSACHADRSANRGKCVYPCRENFTFEGQKKHIFSMKDLAQSENVLKLRELGVTALKIEGRKKNALYVASVTDYYRSILNGEKRSAVLQQKMNNLRTIFSRMTTPFYLIDKKNTEVTDTEFVGHRGLKLGQVQKLIPHGKARYIQVKVDYKISRFDGIQIDLPGQERPIGFSLEKLMLNGKDVFEADAKKTVEMMIPPHLPFIPEKSIVYLSSSGAVKGSFPVKKPALIKLDEYPVSVFVALDKNQLSVSCEGETEILSGPFEPAKNDPKATLEKVFMKTDTTGLVIDSISVNYEQVFVPMSALNDVRRRLYEKVVSVLKKNKTEALNELKENIAREHKTIASITTPTKTIVKTDQYAVVEQVLNRNDVDEVIIDLSIDKFSENLIHQKVRFAIPAIMRSYDSLYFERLAFLKDKKVPFEIGNMSGLKMVGPDFYTDWSMYVANEFAARQVLEFGAKKFVISPETPDPQSLADKFQGQAIYLRYSDLPMFISENCPYISLHKKCLSCGGNRQNKINSSYGEFISVMKNCRHFLLNKNPVLNKKINCAINRFDFMNRKWDNAKKVLDEFNKN